MRVVGELKRMSVAHPWRERTTELLMVALHQGGRQAEAVGVYNAARLRLADELGMGPSPALVVDRNWNVVLSNNGFRLFAKGAAPELLYPPINALRLALHPEGMQPRIINFRKRRDQLLQRPPAAHRADRRAGADRAVPGAARLSERQRAGPPAPHLPHTGAATAVPGRGAPADLHHRHLRHAAGRDRRGAGREAFLPAAGVTGELLRVLHAAAPAGQRPFSAGSKIATHST